MGTISWTNTSHRLSDDVFGVVLGNWLAGGVHFSKVPPELVCDGGSLMGGNWSKLEGTKAHRLSFEHTASEERFESLYLFGREIFGVADHGRSWLRV
jgi:hypothetical protein